jgi:hypothetical protein
MRTVAIAAAAVIVAVIVAAGTARANSVGLSTSVTLNPSPAILDQPAQYALTMTATDSQFDAIGPVTDTLPAGTVFDSASPAADCEPGCDGTTPATVTWTAPCSLPLSMGNSCTINVNVTFPSATFTNGQQVSDSFVTDATSHGGASQSYGPGISVDEVQDASPAVSVSSGFTSSSPKPSPPLNTAFGYAIDIGNSGNVPLDGTTVTDQVPVQMSISSVMTGAYSGLSNFAAGEGVQVRYEKDTAPGVFTLWGSSPNTTTNTTLTAPPPGLGAGEYITAIEWDYGQAAAGSSATTKPAINGQLINPDNAADPVTAGNTIQNCVSAGATYTAGPQGVSDNDCQSFVLHAASPPGITSDASTTFDVGSSGSFPITTSGFPDAAISKTGSLPSGVMLQDNGDGTATLSGTPDTGTAGTYPITINATNGVNPPAQQSFTLQVDQVPGMLSGNSDTFTVGSHGSFSVTTTGTPAPALSEVGALPNPVTFHDNGDGTATLSGTPDAGTGGTYPFTITAANGVTPDATQSFTLTVDEAPGITSADAAGFTVGSNDSFVIHTSGFPGRTITELGTLPDGLSFADNSDGTATISGKPDAGTANTYPITVKATNGVGPNAQQSFTVTVDRAAAPTIAAAVDDAASGQAWSGHEAPGASALGEASLGGLVSGDAPTGSVGYSFFNGGTCSGVATTVGEVSIAGDGSVPRSSATPALSAGTYSLQVAYAGDGSYPSASSACESFTVLGPPSAQITAPADGATFDLEQTVQTSFSCVDAIHAPGLASCADSNGANGTTGALDTSTAGTFTYSVKATSKDGQSATASIRYTVRPSNRFRVGGLHTHHDGRVTFKLTVPGPGAIDLLETAWLDNFAHAATLKPAAGRFVFARKRVTAGGPGTITITVAPNARGKQLVARHRYAVVIRLWVSFTPTSGIVRSQGLKGLHITRPLRRH